MKRLLLALVATLAVLVPTVAVATPAQAAYGGVVANRSSKFVTVQDQASGRWFNVAPGANTGWQVPDVYRLRFPRFSCFQFRDVNAPYWHYIRTGSTAGTVILARDEYMLVRNC